MSSYKIKQKVMHFREGLSLITEEKEMNGSSYFLVKVLREGGETIYVPIARADAIIRPLIDKKEVPELVSHMKSIQPDSFSNTKQRRDVFKRRLTSGDIKDLAYLTMQLYYFNHPEATDKNVKFGPADVDMLKYAARTLYDELALSLKIDRDKVEEEIEKQIRA